MDEEINRKLEFIRVQHPELAGLQNTGLGQCLRNATMPRFVGVGNHPFLKILNIGDHWVRITNTFSDEVDEVFI